MATRKKEIALMSPSVKTKSTAKQVSSKMSEETSKDGDESPSENKTLTQFTCFDRLPLEIQRTVWSLHCAMNGRLVELGMKEMRNRTACTFNIPNGLKRYMRKDIGWTCNAPVPSVLQVCRESRKEALRSYELSFPTYREFIETIPANIYYNDFADTLYLTTASLKKFPASMECLTNDMKDIKFLAIAATLVDVKCPFPESVSTFPLLVRQLPAGWPPAGMLMPPAGLMLPAWLMPPTGLTPAGLLPPTWRPRPVPGQTVFDFSQFVSTFTRLEKLELVYDHRCIRNRCNGEGGINNSIRLRMATPDTRQEFVDDVKKAWIAACQKVYGSADGRTPEILLREIKCKKNPIQILIEPEVVNQPEVAEQSEAADQSEIHDGKEYFEVSRILKAQIRYNHLNFKVQWKHERPDPKWYRAELFDKAPEVIAKFYRRYPNAPRQLSRSPQAKAQQPRRGPGRPRKVRP